jgi:hypothetical protein
VLETQGVASTKRANKTPLHIYAHKTPKNRPKKQNPNKITPDSFVRLQVARKQQLTTKTQGANKTRTKPEQN